MMALIHPPKDTNLELQNDLKAPILTVEIGSEDVETIDEDKDSTNHSTNINGIIVLLIATMMALFSVNVYALEDEEEYKVEDLRECLVGNIPCESYLDYNDDGKVDIVDVVFTRNTIDVNFEKLLNTDPGFKEMHKFSPNINNEEVKKTSQAIVVKSTTRKTAMRTTKGGSKKTTTKKDRTTRGTTTRTSRETTTRTTRPTTTRTTRGTTTRTTRTTTQKATYQVNVVANNGKVISESIRTVNAGATASFAFNPNTGYTFGSVSCTNGAKGSYTKTSNTLKVSGVTSNSTCTVNFVPRSDIRVSVTGQNGRYTPSYKNVGLGGSTSFTISPNNGYEIAGVSCTNASYSLSGNTLNVSNVTNDSTCTVTYNVRYYSVVVKDAVTGRTINSMSVPYNYTYTGTADLNRKDAKVYINGKKVSGMVILELDNGLWRYNISRKITENLVIEFR